MKNLWFAFWEEFDRIFNDPREIHRVVVIMLFAILMREKMEELEKSSKKLKTNLQI